MGLTRRAILIDGDHQESGTNVDVIAWNRFLRSPCGGGWNEDEIKTFRGPQNSALQAELQSASRCDYVFIAFHGHGCTATNVPNSPTHIQLNNHGELIEIRSLLLANTRCTVIADSCRNPMNITWEFSREERPESDYQRELRESARNLFDQAIIQSSDDCKICFGCDVGEFANGEEVNGGWYTQALIERSEHWFKEMNSRGPTGLRIRSLFDAHADAKAVVVNLAANQICVQNPQFSQLNPSTSFPFAVCPI